MESGLTELAHHRYAGANLALWRGRLDAEANGEAWYWHQVVQPLELTRERPAQNSIVVVGCCTDEGVKRNQGRAGAAAAPDAIRTFLASLPHHFESQLRVCDAGNLLQPDDNLEKTHDAIEAVVTQLIQANCFPVLLGGGHDIAYPHVRGIQKALGAKTKIGIINFDAHFDLRDHSVRHSGTPFFQIAQENIGRFHYLCLGIQTFSNTPFHFKRARELGVETIASEHFAMPYWEHIQRKLTDFMDRVEHLYVTVDMDGFASAYAPGVSAPSPLGFVPDVVLASLQLIARSGKLVSLDVVECNPLFDVDGRTARLAARLIAHTVALKR
ncbi:MAG: formimidoylglutamase [Cyclobacteriaceae bacterium]|jgi:formiminoglutamase|nr:formimidoylglutamase [Cyclobacteriaceae bacterium]